MLQAVAWHAVDLVRRLVGAIQAQGHTRSHHIAELIFLGTLHHAIETQLSALIRYKESVEEQDHQDRQATLHLLTLLTTFHTVSVLLLGSLATLTNVFCMQVPATTLAQRRLHLRLIEEVQPSGARAEVLCQLNYWVWTIEQGITNSRPTISDTQAQNWEMPGSWGRSLEFTKTHRKVEPFEQYQGYKPMPKDTKGSGGSAPPTFPKYTLPLRILGNLHSF